MEHRDPLALQDPLVILEEMAEMVKMEISVIPVTLDPLGQVEIRAPREYKDHLETLDLLAPRGPQEKPGNLEEKGAGEFQDFEGSLDREAPRDRLVVTGSQEQRAQQERMGPRVRTVMWDLPAPTDHQDIVDQKALQDQRARLAAMDLLDHLAAMD